MAQNSQVIQLLLENKRSSSSTEIGSNPCAAVLTGGTPDSSCYALHHMACMLGMLCLQCTQLDAGLHPAFLQVELPSGVRYTDLRIGGGQRPIKGYLVVVDYV